jgi:hypothetical protein
MMSTHLGSNVRRGNPFRAEVERRTNVTIVRLHGEIDIAGLDHLDRMLGVAQKDKDPEESLCSVPLKDG